MPDINLLPEDLRAEETKQLNQTPSSSPSAMFHIPQTNSIPIKNEAPAPLPQNNPIGPAVLKPVKNQFIGANFSSFNLDEEAKKGPLPGFNQASVAANPALLGQQGGKLKSTNQTGFLSRLFNKKQAKGRIIRNVEKKTDRPADTGKTVDVNLIPEGSDLLPSKKIYNFLIYYALVGIVADVLLFVGVALYQRQIVIKQQQLTAKVSESEVRYNQLKAKEDALSGWYNKVQSIKTLFENHIYWTIFFSRLESVTIPDIYYKDITTAIDGTVTLSAVSTGGYTGVAKQYLAYQQASDLIKEVNVSNLTGDVASSDVNFTVNLMVDPDVYFVTQALTQPKK